MSIIRRFSYFDGFKVKKMIAFLGNDEAERFIKVLMNNSFDFIHRFIPLKYKFLPETYVLEDNKDLHGMITVLPTRGNPYKWNITKLLFEQNYFDIGKQLIEYIVSKYGAKGAENFVLTVDDNNEELLDLFIKGCGFRQCSSEVLYKVSSKKFNKKVSKNLIFRPFKNSDSSVVADVYNHSVINLFRPSMLKCEKEFSEIFFQGFSNSYELNYVLEDYDLKKILSFFTVTTFDNINYTVNIVAQEGYNIDYDVIFGFVQREILKRNRNFNLFLKIKKYLKNAEALETYIKEKDGTCVRNQIVLVKDFYKLISENAKSLKMVVFNDIVVN